MSHSYSRLCLCVRRRACHRQARRRTARTSGALRIKVGKQIRRIFIPSCSMACAGHTYQRADRAGKVRSGRCARWRAAATAAGTDDGVGDDSRAAADVALARRRGQKPSGRSRSSWSEDRSAQPHRRWCGSMESTCNKSVAAPPVQGAWVMSGVLVPLSPAVPASEGRDGDDR